MFNSEYVCDFHFIFGHTNSVAWLVLTIRSKRRAYTTSNTPNFEMGELGERTKKKRFQSQVLQISDAAAFMCTNIHFVGEREQANGKMEMCRLIR